MMDKMLADWLAKVIEAGVSYHQEIIYDPKHIISGTGQEITPPFLSLVPIPPVSLETGKILFNQEVKSMPDEKTPEQLRLEMYEKVKAQNAEYMNEVALPGVIRPVEPNNPEQD